ncbi:WD40-repeat-containing domain protein [Podospora fimiseda]|uniref:WD40-repeat-containing domain protein n=1 Tax=Podospora fimiseda TaxID=252190 RepID=A0AAN7BEQ7_9PEZI|nr:WD40-repeat-containing domain protein [Podospora fimiseda]
MNAIIAGVSGQGDSVFLWDLNTESFIDCEIGFAHESDINSLAFSPNGRFLLSALDDGTAQVCHIETGKRLLVLDCHGDWVREAAWCDDGLHIATGSDDGSIRIWKVDELQPIMAEISLDPLQIIESAHSGRYVTSVAFGPRGKYLISGGNDQKVRVWNRVDEEPFFKFEQKTVFSGHTSSIPKLGSKELKG